MPQKRRYDPEFRKAVAAALRLALKQRDLNETEAANELGITKQAFNQYLREKATPKAHILARAVALWKIKLRYRNYDFSEGAFRTTFETPAEHPFQHELFRDPQVVENDKISVRIESKSGDNLDITIRLKRSA